MSDDTMNQLCTVSELAKHFKRSHGDMRDLLAELNVPSQSVKHGTKTMALYNMSIAMERVKAALEATRPAKAEPLVPTAFTEAIEDLAAKLDTSNEVLTKVTEQNALLLRAFTEQHALILRAIADLRVDMSNRVNALQTSVDAAEDREATRGPLVCRGAAVAETPSNVTPIAQAPRIKHDPAPASAKVTKPRIAIVGLHGSHATIIEKEFGPIFDICFIEMEGANKPNVRDKVARCHSVFLCPSSATGSITALTAAAGSRLVRVMGGISMLRDKLTGLYVKLADGETVHG